MTIREHLEAIRRGRYLPDEEHPFNDDEYGITEYRKHAVAALALTSEMETRLRSVIDYLECAGALPCVKNASASCDECAVRWDCEYLLASLVPDAVASRNAP